MVFGRFCYCRKAKTSMSNRERGPKKISMGDWKQVGTDLRQATVEVAGSLGGQEITTEAIGLAGDSSQLLPCPEALKFLDAQFPGAAEKVISRAEQIQQTRLKLEGGNFVSSILRKLGIKN